MAEANQVVFFNRDEEYSVSHPVDGGDASLSVEIAEPLLRELAPKDQMEAGAALAFRRQRLRIDPRTQVPVALLRRCCWRGRVGSAGGIPLPPDLIEPISSVVFIR